MNTTKGHGHVSNNSYKKFQDIKSKAINIIHTEEVVLGTEQGTMFPTHIGTTRCNALIDTGATKSCVSEKFYQQLPPTTIQKLHHVSVKSATGSDLTPLGVIHCSFTLDDILFRANLIMCRNLTCPLILGRDFLLQHHIAVKYADSGKCILAYQQQELVASIDIEDKLHKFIWLIL